MRLYLDDGNGEPFFVVTQQTTRVEVFESRTGPLLCTIPNWLLGRTIEGLQQVFDAINADNQLRTEHLKLQSWNMAAVKTYKPEETA